MLFKAVQQAIVRLLWERYVQATPFVQTLMHAFQADGKALPPLDHFAVIDLPGLHTGIATMRAIFERLHFDYQDCGYLPEKQNGFAWLRERASSTLLARDALPQVVVADFQLDALSPDIAAIVSHYANLAPIFPFDQLDALLARVTIGDETAVLPTVTLITDYFHGRDWPLPTRAEIELVRASNELLAWVLVFGRCPNHFTLAMHLSTQFSDFTSFLAWVEDTLGMSLNDQAGRIKGSAQVGIEQASTQSASQLVRVADGDMSLAAPFVEFVWRYPLDGTRAPRYFADYFADFIPAQANNVVESLYDK